MNARYLEFNIGSHEQVFSNDSYKNMNIGKNILIGNSADPANNHLDIIEMIDPAHIDQCCKIYCPLSYAITNINYVEHVINEGNSKFGSNFVPLNKYLNKKDYTEIVASCDVVVLNQHRSQGILSAFAAFYFRKTLFLNRKNPFYDYVINLGMNVFTIDSDLNLKDRLSEKQLDENSKIYRDHFNEKKVFLKYKNLVN